MFSLMGADELKKTIPETGELKILTPGVGAMFVPKNIFKNEFKE